MKWQQAAMFVVWTIFTWFAGVSMGVTAAVIAPTKMREIVRAIQSLDPHREAKR